MFVNKAEVSDLVGRNHFVCLDYFPSYWQCPLEPVPYNTCKSIAFQEAFVFTRVLRVLRNTRACFKSTSLPLFDSINHPIKAQIDDFTDYTTTTSMLFKYPSDRFSIRISRNLRLLPTKPVFYTKKFKWCWRIIYEACLLLDTGDSENGRSNHVKSIVPVHSLLLMAEQPHSGILQ